MGEVSTEFPDSLIPAATAKAAQIGRALRRVSAAAELDLVDIDLDPSALDEETREELARLGNEVLAILHQGQSLVMSLVEAGSLGVEQNGGGLPLRITSGAGMLELEAPSQNGDGEAAKPAAEDEPPAPDEPEEPSADEDSPEPEADSPKVDVVIDGFAHLENDDLGLNAHEIALLKALPDLDGQPLTRRWIMEHGYCSSAVSEAARNQTFLKAIQGVIDKFETATGTRILEKVGEKSQRRYLVNTAFKIDGAEVVVSDEVKKN